MLRRGWPAVPFVVLVTAICAWPALEAPFTFDEHAGLVENRTVQPGSPVSAALTYRFSPDQIRPVFFLSLWLNARTGGIEPFPFRLTNLLLHIACGLLVGLLLMRAFTRRAGDPDRTSEEGDDPAPTLRGRIAALSGMTLFLLHPLQSESILYIWGRSGVLSTLGLLGALLLALAAADTNAARPRLRAALWCATVAAFALALLSKEEAIVLPLILFIWWTVAERRPVGEGLRRAALLVLPAALFLMARGSYLGAVGRQVYARGIWDNMLSQAVVSLKMIRLTILPIGQSVDPEAGLPSMGPGLAALAACGIIVLGAILLARVSIRPDHTERPGRPIHLIACGVLIAAAATAIYWLVPLPDLMSERRAYLPMLGAAIVIAGIVQALLPLAIGGDEGARGVPSSPKQRFFAALPVLLLMLNLGPLLHLRARIWADPVTLWMEAARHAPTRVRAYVNLGVYAADRGDLEGAAGYFERAVAADPTDHEALFNRARLYMEAGDLAAARADLEGAIASSPGMLRARINLGIIFIQQGHMTAAEETLRDVLAVDPGEPRALTNLAEVLRATDRTAEAKPLYLAALASDPGYAHAAARLGVTLEGEGDLIGALDAYRQYLDRGPASPEQDQAVRDKITEIERRLSAAPGAVRTP